MKTLASKKADPKIFCHILREPYLTEESKVQTLLDFIFYTMY